MSGYDKLFSAIVTCSFLLQTADWHCPATCHVYCDLTLWSLVNLSYLTACYHSLTLLCIRQVIMALISRLVTDHTHSLTSMQYLYCKHHGTTTACPDYRGVHGSFTAKPSSHQVHVTLWATTPTSSCPTLFCWHRTCAQVRGGYLFCPVHRVM